ncbi:MAG: rhodanese-like domain-containing protein [Angelakisella sp.]
MITAEEAKKMMDGESDYIILDVRTKEEFDEGHINNAVLIPDSEIKQRAEAELPQKDQLILVYCRSGRRSAAAAEELVSMGYTNVKDFGGISDWPYDIV